MLAWITSYWVAIFGVLANAGCIATYALETKSRWWSIGFAVACVIAGGYALLLPNGWPIAAAEVFWITAALHKFRAVTRMTTEYQQATAIPLYGSFPTLDPEDPSLVWYTDLRDANYARQKEYRKGGPQKPPILSYWGNALAGEIGEACNIIKKIDRFNMGWAGGKAPSIEKLAHELADGKIYIALLEAELGIDGDAAVEYVFNAKSVDLGMKTRLCLTGDRR